MGIRLNRQEFTALLDEAARQVPAGVGERLAIARRIALQRQAQRNPLQAFLYQRIAALAVPAQRHRIGWSAALLAVLLLAAALQWQPAPVHDHSALDLAILTDELPVSMYVD
ncbi:MAG: DUF3619 family protein [Gallionella sp.]|nr:DUF3619 family protein [Gallionella sp.]OIO11555.1 MAG: hypothetical protein AUJ80_02045 [Gallionellaceae bacterium CG1_02_60_325]PIR09343.1 MAG: hypothetical protein COV51_04825 [Gallionellaceae bacterium CG11_big_fil_rev_8_21_14_0_20_60_62]PIY06267.1 MAG: hypothetical protein COZ19_01490 [Gallionellaceae bacterium CG_4_10_14_3_um_filter_60_1069]PJC04409.1 MAG: hypothetical protein CO069_03570 [Gallionellaceae bacterium CG_4_9_14_0_8_um_filter_60_335]